MAVATLPYQRAVDRYPYLRQSVLSDFDNCGLAGHFSAEYEDGWSSHPAARGTIVHRTIAKALEAMEDAGEDRPNVDLVVDALLPEVIRQAEEALTDAPGGETVVTVPAREIASARISLKAWAGNVRLSVENFAGVEKRLVTELGYPDGEGAVVKRLFTGKLDLLLIEQGDHAIVLDWKDTFGIPPESKISEEGFFQQRSYALLVFRYFPRVQRVTLREFYLRYASGNVLDRRGRLIDPVREATIDRHALPEVEGEMNALVERFDRAWDSYLEATPLEGEAPAAFDRRRRRFFSPAPGSHCSYCPRPEACPILPAARREGRITSAEQAELVAGRLNVAEAYSDSARKSLRAWSNIHGDVPIKDAKRPRVYGPVVRLRTPRPELDAVRDRERRGLPVADLYEPEEYVTFAVHTPEEVHPFAKAARVEEEMLLAAEKARNGRSKRGKR